MAIAHHIAMLGLAALSATVANAPVFEWIHGGNLIRGSSQETCR